ncbi:hypothetical protein BJ170DRAFT_591986 [Xylariales sp. AK1849]|nr:hypothetical protein BJ170DRAFT_591986 [Xylariales sp. AK1849]
MSINEPTDWSTLGPPPDDGHGHNTKTGDLGTIGPEIIGVCWMLAFVCSLFLAARLYAKFTTHRGLWWDDHLLIAAWTMLVAFVSVTTYAVHGGLGTHDGSGLNDPAFVQLMITILTVLAAFGAAWSKTSFAITLLRITSGYVKLILWAIVISLNVVLTFNAILPFVWCSPAQKGWTPTMMIGTCWDRQIVIKYMTFSTAYSAAMDFVLAVVPWAVIMKLNMAYKEKIGFAVCLSLAVVAGITSIERCVNIRLQYQEDYTFEAGRLTMWTAAETAVTIIAASIPVLRMLIRNIVTHKAYSNSGGNGSTFQRGTHTSMIVSSRRIQSGHGGKSGSTLGDEESLASLGLPSSALSRSESGRHIMKFEEVTVDYERRSQSSNANGAMMNVDFDMGRVIPRRPGE